MVNPSVLRQLGKEHDREILAACRTPRGERTLVPHVRQRLGWSLIGLGIHFVLDGRGARPQSLRPVTRP